MSACVCVLERVGFFFLGEEGERLWKLECTQKVNFSSQKRSAGRKGGGGGCGWVCV